MNRLTLTLCLIICAFGFHAMAQSEQEMKAWTDYMTPGDVHQMMAKWDGHWHGDITLWMQPGAPPLKNTGTAVNKMILGGRYQESRHSGNFMGMPFEGVSITGWDNSRKLMMSTWIDNMGTGIMYLEGPWDPNTKTATLKGSSTDPLTGKSMQVREVFKIVDDNTQIMEMYTTLNGQEFRSMEVKLTRKK